MLMRNIPTWHKLWRILTSTNSIWHSKQVKRQFSISLLIGCNDGDLSRPIGRCQMQGSPALADGQMSGQVPSVGFLSDDDDEPVFGRSLAQMVRALPSRYFPVGLLFHSTPDISIMSKGIGCSCGRSRQSSLEKQRLFTPAPHGESAKFRREQYCSNFLANKTCNLTSFPCHTACAIKETKCSF